MEIKEQNQQQSPKAEAAVRRIKGGRTTETDEFGLRQWDRKTAQTRTVTAGEAGAAHNEGSEWMRKIPPCCHLRIRNEPATRCVVRQAQPPLLPGKKE